VATSAIDPPPQPQTSSLTNYDVFGTIVLNT